MGTGDRAGVAVLLADSQPEVAAAAANVLEREDERFAVETVCRVAEGLDRLAEDEFDCVVSAHEMPDRTGLEFLETVREADPVLPFILLVTRGSEEVASEAISAGVTDHLRKERGVDRCGILASRIGNAVERTRARRERERQLRAIESAQEGIGILDENGTFVYVNEAYADLYGYEPGELIDEHWELLYRDDDAAYVRDEVMPTIEEVGRWSGTTTGVRADGSTFVTDSSITTTDHGDLVCTVRDATEREDLSQRYELVARASADAFFDWDPNTGEIARSKGYLPQFDYDETDVEAEVDWWRERIHPEDRDRVLSALEEALADPGTAYDETYRFRRKGGAYGCVRSRGYVAYDGNGDPRRMVGAHIDVTERKEREQAITELHTTTRDMIQAETKVDISEIGVEAARDIVGLPLTSIQLYDDAENLLRPVAYTTGVEDLFDEVPTIEPGGSIIWRAFASGDVEVQTDVLDDPDVMNPDTPVRSQIILPLGSHGALICNSTEVGNFERIDVTLAKMLAENIRVAMDRIEREGELRERAGEIEQQNERLERFTQVVSHDLRNPLGIASGRLELARDDEDDEHLDAVARAHDRMERLIEDLLTLASQGRAIGETDRVSLQNAVDTAWASVGTTHASLAVIDELPPIEADGERLHELLENLFRNAVEHGSTGSRTRSDDSVEHGSTSDRPPANDGVEHGSAGDRTAAGDAIDRAGSGVTVTVGRLPDGFYVADDGPGIPADDREAIFETGYTTAEHGTGFSLAIVTEIAEGHGWDVSATDPTGGGARFEVTSVELAEG